MGAQILREMLARARDGAISTQSLRKELDGRNVADPQELIARLRALEPGDQPGGPEQSRWFHLGRSFYTEAKYREAQRAQDALAAEASAADAVADPVTSEEEAEEETDTAAPRERRKRRSEEARLGTYIVRTLEEIYDDEASPEKYVFDVHSLRGGSDFENVDLLAVHWRSPKVIDIVTVEVKLKFTAFLVQQARNYTRFSERVWIAMPVDATTAHAAAMELRGQDHLLFEHVVEVGLGILGCHRGRGNSYNVFPVHWPRRNQVDPREREELVKRYRNEFEESGVIPPATRSYPRL
jgi:hypothetical protein